MTASAETSRIRLKSYFGKSKKRLTSECHNTKYKRIREETLIAICQYSINVFLKNHETCIDSIVDIVREASVAALNDDEPLRMYQKQLDKVEKELTKNLLAWREAPDQSMRDAFYEMYLANKSQKEDLEQKIREIHNRQQDMSELEESILGIEKKIEDMKQIKVIDRQVVENFIDRIIIHKDGTINVVLKFGSTFNAALKSMGFSDYTSIPYLPMDHVKISNLRFINNKDLIGKYMLYIRLARCSDRTSCSSILPQYIPIFVYGYQEKNLHRQTRNNYPFVCAEYIETDVVTCLRQEDH